MAEELKACPTQQGEAVEVVAWVDPSALNLMSKYGYHSCTAKAVRVPCFTEPLMTVAQHQRILAATVPAGCKVVPVELLERIIGIYDNSIIDAAYWTDMDGDIDKLRAILEAKDE